MKAFFTLLHKEATEIFRSKKLLILGIIFGFVAISSPIIAKIIPEIFKNIQTGGITFNIPEPTWRDAIDQLVKNTSQFGLIVIIFMFAGAVAEEKSKKTLEMLLTKPISRVSFVLSKFVSAKLYISGVFVLSAVVFYSYAVSLFSNFSLANYAWLILFLLVYLLTILAVTIFFSTISKSQIMAVGLAFFGSIIFTTIIGYIKAISDYSPAYIVANYKDLMLDGKFANFLPSFYTSIGIIIVLVVLSIIFFQKQEIER